ncbi:hypothetical protein K0M31_013798 [Melipona bicolor]|uniref:Uncharacterized protein n=1 Tax=Melipona bicolor TaxID=60889 RepID=A0AA40FH96_9HYME|nr:hypothetical protein K0M31_013798 [Melipona bicolor]
MSNWVFQKKRGKIFKVAWMYSRRILARSRKKEVRLKGSVNRAEGVAVGVAAGTSTTLLGVSPASCKERVVVGEKASNATSPQLLFNRSMVSMLRCFALRVDLFLPETKKITCPSIKS